MCCTISKALILEKNFSLLCNVVCCMTLLAEHTSTYMASEKEEKSLVWKFPIWCCTNSIFTGPKLWDPFINKKVYFHSPRNQLCQLCEVNEWREERKFPWQRIWRKNAAEKFRFFYYLAAFCFVRMNDFILVEKRVANAWRQQSNHNIIQRKLSHQSSDVMWHFSPFQFATGRFFLPFFQLRFDEDFV